MSGLAERRKSNRRRPWRARRATKATATVAGECRGYSSNRTKWIPGLWVTAPSVHREVRAAYACKYDPEQTSEEEHPAARGSARVSSLSFPLFHSLSLILSFSLPSRIVDRRIESEAHGMKRVARERRKSKLDSLFCSSHVLTRSGTYRSEEWGEDTGGTLIHAASSSARFLHLPLPRSHLFWLSIERNLKRISYRFLIPGGFWDTLAGGHWFFGRRGNFDRARMIRDNDNRINMLSGAKDRDLFEWNVLRTTKLRSC